MPPTCPYCESTDVQPDGRQYRCQAAKCRMPFLPAPEPEKPAPKKPKGQGSKGDSGAE